MKRALAGALLVVFLVAAATAPARRTARSADCSKTSVGLAPLTDLKTAKYRGYRGGLYPSGRNAPPASYLRQGLAAAKSVRPRSDDGRAAAGGKIVLLSVGMSNATQEYSAFKRLADADPERNPSLILVDGAQGGQDDERISDPAANS